MAGDTSHVTHGTLLTFTDSAWTSEITGITWDGIERASIDTAHFSTTAASANELGGRTFKPGGLVDPGSLSIEGNFDPDQDPPVGALAEQITVTFPPIPAESSATWAGEGFMMSFSFTGSLDEKFTFSAVVKFSGLITLTPYV